MGIVGAYVLFSLLAKQQRPRATDISGSSEFPFSVDERRRGKGTGGGGSIETNAAKNNDNKSKHPPITCMPKSPNREACRDWYGSCDLTKPKYAEGRQGRFRTSRGRRRAVRCCSTALGRSNP